MKKTNLNKLSTNIRANRKKMDFSREELAKRAKVNYNTIIKLESGANKNPTIKTLIGLSQVFKIDVSDLIR